MPDTRCKNEQNKDARAMRGSYRDLDVYQQTHALAVLSHKFSLRLPKFELYETGSQLRRASKSISANIVEGYGRRRYKQEFVRFLVYALASCDETREWLSYIHDCHEEHSEEAETLISKVEETGRRLNKFLQAVESSHQSPK
jgi:four helix bundle protein